MPKAKRPVKRSKVKRVARAKTPAQLARAGNLKALYAIADLKRSANDRDAYKWLCAAADFGHEDADDYISDVLEVTTMRYDDSGYERAAAHWELAAAYLEGADGLPVDLALARQHLDEAFVHHATLDAINVGVNGSYSADELRARLSDDARRVLDAGLAGDDLERAVRCIDMIRRLIEVGAPEVMVGDQQRALRALVASACPLPTAAAIERMGSDPLDDEIGFLEAVHAEVGATLELLRAEQARRRT